MTERIPVRVITENEKTTIEVKPGANLRGSLLDHGFSVYGTLSQYANCGGRGLCSTCTVEIDSGPEPSHWHDAAAVRFGYPRLSCCITVEKPMTVRLLDKHVWGQVFPRQVSPD